MPKEVEDCVVVIAENNDVNGAANSALPDGKSSSSLSKVEKRVLFAPLLKDAFGNVHAFLSDDSIDREDEFMSPELIRSWAQKGSLPALSDHSNTMDNWVGGWTQTEAIEKDGHIALKATPQFFSEKANPKADRVKRQIEEGNKMGLMPGVSIGAIPKSFEDVTRDGKKYRMWKEAELVEASFVPVQANRNAYAYVAKRYNGGLTMESDQKQEAQTQTVEKSAVVQAPVEVTQEVPAAYEKRVKDLETELLTLKEGIKTQKDLETKVADLVAKSLEGLKAEKKSFATEEKAANLPPLKNM